jgi:hypothetical protein
MAINPATYNAQLQSRIDAANGSTSLLDLTMLRISAEGRGLNTSNLDALIQAKSDGVDGSTTIKDLAILNKANAEAALPPAPSYIGEVREFGLDDNITLHTAEDGSQWLRSGHSVAGDFPDWLSNDGYVDTELTRLSVIRGTQNGPFIGGTASLFVDNAYSPTLDVIVVASTLGIYTLNAATMAQTNYYAANQDVFSADWLPGVNRFVVCKATNCFTSTDGLSWSTVTVPELFAKIIYVPGFAGTGMYFAQPHASKAGLYTSTDFTNWTYVAAYTGSQAPRGLAVSADGTRVAALTNSHLVTSTNGTGWTATSHVSSFDAQFNLITFDATGGFFIAFTNNGEFIFSTTGATIGKSASGGAYAVNSIVKSDTPYFPAIGFVANFNSDWGGFTPRFVPSPYGSGAPFAPNTINAMTVNLTTTPTTSKGSALYLRKYRRFINFANNSVVRYAQLDYAPRLYRIMDVKKVNGRFRVTGFHQMYQVPICYDLNADGSLYDLAPVKPLGAIYLNIHGTDEALEYKPNQGWFFVKSGQADTAVSGMGSSSNNYPITPPTYFSDLGFYYFRTVASSHISANGITWTTIATIASSHMFGPYYVKSVDTAYIVHATNTSTVTDVYRLTGLPSSGTNTLEGTLAGGAVLAAVREDDEHIIAYQYTATSGTVPRLVRINLVTRNVEVLQASYTNLFSLHKTAFGYAILMRPVSNQVDFATNDVTVRLRGSYSASYAASQYTPDETDAVVVNATSASGTPVLFRNTYTSLEGNMSTSILLLPSPTAKFIGKSNKQFMRVK